MKRSFIEYGGHRLAVYTGGNDEGPACVFVHGGPGGRSPLDFGDLLSEHFRTVMYDQYGGGDSDPYNGEDDLDADYYMAEARDVIPRLVSGDYVIIGYSWGAVPAVAYASSCRDPHFKGLILLSPFLSGPLWTRDQLDILRGISPEMAEDMARYVREGYVGDEAMEILAELFENVLFTEEENRKRARGFAHVPYGKVCLKLWGKNDGIPIGPLKDLDMTGVLRNISVPVLVIFGDRDQVTEETASYYCNNLRYPKYAEIVNAGHYSIREKPLDFINEMSKFINNC